MILAHDCNLEFSRKSTNDLIEDGLESFSLTTGRRENRMMVADSSNIVKIFNCP